jgi:hypothetical protein
VGYEEESLCVVCVGEIVQGLSRAVLVLALDLEARLLIFGLVFLMFFPNKEKKKKKLSLQAIVMGCGASSPEQAEMASVSKAIDRELRAAKEESMSEAKLLLLGSASAGKSTFAKQFRILFLGGFTAQDLAMYKEQVMFCVWRNMRILASRACVRDSEEFSRDCAKLGAAFLLHEGRVTDFSEFVGVLKVMWSLNSVQQALQQSRCVCLSL